MPQGCYVETEGWTGKNKWLICSIKRKGLTFAIMMAKESISLAKYPAIIELENRNSVLGPAV